MDGEFFAQAAVGLSVPVLLGPPPPAQLTCPPEPGNFYLGEAEARSCISYLDAFNKAKLAAYKQAFAEMRELDCPQNQADLSEMEEDGFTNDEITLIVDCPCGWDGGPVVKVQPAGVYTGYSQAEANWKAWNDLDPYDPTPDGCFAPI